MNGVTTAPSCVRVVDGQLLLARTASAGGYVTTNPDDGVAGHVGFAIGYGIVEAQLNFASLEDWDAFWMCGAVWPQQGEIDIAEVLAGALTSNYHSGGPSQGSTDVPNNGPDVPGNWTTGMHTYTVVREEGQNSVYFDGVLARPAYPTYDGGAPQHIILNVGSGPALGTQMTVNYVSAWALS